MGREVRIMPLRDAINYVTDKLSQDTTAKLLGITKNQVYKYQSGFTKTCSDKVVDAMYDNFNILINVYNDEDEYLKFRAIREKVKES